MATLKGIDVSVHQGDIDWTKVKGNVDFAILRAGYGNSIKYPKQIDDKFERNYKGCKDSNIDCGVYWYSYAKTVSDAQAEARACLSAIKGKTFEYPIFYDLEESSQFALGKTVCSNLVTAFCKVIEDAGYYAGLYISRSPLQTHISDSVAKRYALWIAEYASACNYSGSFGMWQNSSTGEINGISGNVDTDYCYVDYSSLVKSKGMNGYSANSGSANDLKILDKSGFKKGDKSDGVLAYKCLLLLAKKAKIITQGVDENGTFGDGTEKATNQLLKKFGYKECGIAGTNIIKKLRAEIEKKV